MKAATSVDRFDERRRFTTLGEEMGRVRLDSDANEATAIWRTEHVRRSGDLAEGSPDDGFRPTLTHLVDPLTSLDGWAVTPLLVDDPEDDRVVAVTFELTRRDPETLPRVVHVRGVTEVVRTLPHPLDLLRLPVPGSRGATYAATALVVHLRVQEDITEDETPAVVLRDGAGVEHRVSIDLDAAPSLDSGSARPSWRAVRIDALAVLPRTPLPDGGEAALLTGWGLTDVPPRAHVWLGALEADPGLPESDLVVRGGDGTVAGAGRLYVGGRRTFIEEDWRYSLQPDLPDPAPLVRPAPRPLPDGSTWNGSHLLYVDVVDVVVHGFQDPFIREPALDGEDTTFRTRQLTQVRALPEQPDERGLPPRQPVLPPIRGEALLTTNVPAGALPDRFPAEQADPCRDRCLTTGSAATGEGYTGSRHLNVRLEVLTVDDDGDAVVAWSRDNGATVAPLRLDAPAGAHRLIVRPEHAARFTAGDVVVVEDRLSRLDPEGSGHAPALRRLRTVDSAEGVLELEPAGSLLTSDPRPLDAGGPLPRTFDTGDAAAVRRWDGADWLVPDVRYALSDGLAFAFGGGAPLVTEYWTFTARVLAADGASVGVVEQLTAAPVRGPERVRVPLGRVVWTPTGREIVDLRRRFLPLADVRDRLVEIGRRHLSPGSFTVVVGDGVRTFGDVDQNVLEGVTGDEAIQVAVDRLGAAGGTVYVRAGEYTLEHPVLVQGRSNVRILGDGDATVLTVTGAGGAFYLDWCGHGGEVGLELLRLVEAPEDVTPFGRDLVRDDATGPDVPDDVGGGFATSESLTPGDLLSAAPAPLDVVDAIASRLRVLPLFGGRAAASVVRTIMELRRLQRLHPEHSLEEIAPDQLAVLHGLPHGVVTVADSRGVTLDRLRLESRDTAPGRSQPSGVLLTGTLEGVTVIRCRVAAPVGVEAAPYARFLVPLALTLRPRAGLAVTGLALRGNDLAAPTGGDATGTGVRIADGVVEGLVVEDNRVTGFDVGILLEDQAEDRAGQPVDRTSVHRNVVAGVARTGIAVLGDGVDVAGNEVRLADGRRPAVRAGIALGGQGARVRDNWVSLPAAPGPLLGVEAGVLVGGGVDDGDLVARPVHDVEVTGNRVEGAGDAGTAVGVLVGGPQPIAQVRVTRNTLRSLGGAGVRAWGHLGPVTGLHVDGNTVEAVALAPLAWTPAHVAEAGTLAPGVDLGGAVTPRDVLERLLAPGAPTSRAALDAVLRWLEQSTARGGVVLSLVDGALLDGDRIEDVGTRAEQAEPVPDAQVRTAGIALLGGSEHVVRDATVERVRGTVIRVPVGPVQPPVLRPGALDLLRRVAIVSPGTAALRLHGSAVALRDQLMEYTLGTAARRQSLGGRIYAALDAVTAGLETHGVAGRRLAEQLAGATDAMRDAQGFAAHTQASNLARAVLSDAATLTAGSGDVRQAWDLAASFDRAVLGSDSDVVEAATAVSAAAPQLTTGLEALQLDVAGQAGAVVAGQDEESRLALARTLGRAAEGRARAVALAAAVPPGGPTVQDTTLLDGVVRATLEALDTPAPGTVAADVLERVEQGAGVLAGTLDTAHRELATRLRADVGTAVASGGRAADVERLTATLKDVRAFAADPATGLEVRAADVDDQRQRFGAELAVVTADRIEQQIAALPADVETDEARALRILQRSTSQLVNLVAGAPAPVREQASAAARALADAVDDPDGREAHRADARTALRALAEEQSRLAGVAVTAAEPVTPAGDVADADRLAAIAVLVADLPDVTDAGVRAESLTLLDGQLRRAADGLDLGADERTALLGRTGTALGALGQGGETAADAYSALASVVADLAAVAARADDATPVALATSTLTAGLRRAVVPRVAERDLLLDVQRSVAGSERTLSPSLVATVLGTTSLGTARGALRDGLAGLLALAAARPPVVQPRPERLEVQPADGVFAAGVGTSLGVTGARIRTVRSGAVVGEHPLAPLAAGDGLQLSVQRSRV